MINPVITSPSRMNPNLGVSLFAWREQPFAHGMKPISSYAGHFSEDCPEPNFPATCSDEGPTERSESTFDSKISSKNDKNNYKGIKNTFDDMGFASPTTSPARVTADRSLSLSRE